MKELTFNPYPTDNTGQFIIDDFVDVLEVTNLKKKEVNNSETSDTILGLHRACYALQVYIETYLLDGPARQEALKKLVECRMWAEQCREEK